MLQAFRLLLIACLFQVAYCQLEQLFNTTEILRHTEGTAASAEDDARDVEGHLFSLAGNSPMAMKIRQNPKAKRDLNDLVNVFRQFDKISLGRRRRNASYACDPPAQRYLRDSWFSSKVRQIGILEQKCDTTIRASVAVANNELKSKDIRRVRTIMTNAKSSIFEAIKEFPELPSRSDRTLNWTKGTFKLGGWVFQRDRQKCSLENSFAYFREGHWYVGIGVTNAPLILDLGEDQRQYISEHIRDDLGASLGTVHPLFDDIVAGTNVTLAETTTIIERWSGRPGLSSVGNMQFDDNPALVDALKKNAISVDIASDSVTFSNIAILSLPLLMTLVPVAFIADLSSWATLPYAIFTDICSIIPLLMKGIELFRSTTKSEEIVIYKMGTSKLGQMEIFSAECSGESNFRTWGIIFVILSILGLLIGVTFEIYADRYMKKKRLEEEDDDVEGPFGLAGFCTTKDSIFRDGKSLTSAGIARRLLGNKNVNEERINFEYAKEMNRRYSEENLWTKT